MTRVDDPWVGAACREPGVDATAFFPERGDDYEPAKRICRLCPIQQRCGDFIMARETLKGQRDGLWAGMTPRERQKLAIQQELRRRFES